MLDATEPVGMELKEVFYVVVGKHFCTLEIFFF